MRLWPFEGSLEELAKVEGSVIAETYPGEAYAHIAYQVQARPEQTETIGPTG